MDRVIEMQVAGYQIRRGSEALGAMGTGNAVLLRFSFDSTWDGLSKCAKFTDARGEGGITTEVELLTRSGDGSYTIPVPREAMAYEGMAELSLVGELVENGNVAKRLTTKPLSLRIYASGADREAQNTEPITATDKQQILAKVDAAEAYAVGTADGVPVTERARDNAKYYKEQASESAKEAASAAASAKGFSMDASGYVDNAMQYATGAAGHAENAAAYAASAQTAAADAQKSKTDAESAKIAAQAAAQEAMEAAQQGNNIYANALKGTASGAIVRMDDVSPLEHGVKVKVSGVDNPSAVTVTAQGKNLFNYKDFVTWANTIGSTAVESVVYNREDCFSFALWNTNGNKTLFDGIKFKENTQYTVSCEIAAMYTNGSVWTQPIVIRYTDGTEEAASGIQPTGKFNKRTFVSAAGKTIKGIYIPNFSSVCVVYAKKNMQIEEGTMKTDFEPYVPPVTVPVEADGSCTVPSVYPTMTITTDTDGAVVDCEYNRDINKAFAQLAAAIVAADAN